MRRFKPHGGGVRVHISQDERAVLRQLADEYREVLLGEKSDATRRLFPNAYAADPEANAAFIATSHDLLLRKRLDNLDLFEGSIDETQLRIDQAEIWIGIINDIRLVIGTALDVSEDQYPDATDDATYSEIVYSHLGYMLGDLLTALGT
ncbi:MAG: DUF2017 family protein [Acidimicrobiales bacterium]